MGMREKLNQSRLGLGIVAMLSGLVVIYVVHSLLVTGDAATMYSAYYTNDDGQTYFKDDINLIVPFQRNGKEAVRAHVFEAGGRKVVEYLSKLSADARAAIEKYQADCAAKPQARPPSWAAAQTAQANGWLFKKPGETVWVPSMNQLRVDTKNSDGKSSEEIWP